MDQKEYVRESARTVAESYHADLVAAPEIDFMLQAVISAGAWADRIKRALFYGVASPSRNFSNSSIQHTPELKDLVHAMLGCVTESAEIAEHVRDVLTGTRSFDRVNLIEEIGDIAWYQALALRFVESDFEEVFAVNIAKLRARFPGKFTEAAALTRDLVGERAVLETTTPDPNDYGQEIAAYLSSALGKGLDTPSVGTKWRHTSGRIYGVVVVTNEPDNERYPLTVVYQGENGNMWSRRADDWHRSMTPVPIGLLPPDGTPDGTRFLLFRGDSGIAATWTGTCWARADGDLSPEAAESNGWEILIKMPPKASEQYAETTGNVTVSACEWDPQG